MPISQLNFKGLNKVEHSIELIRQYEPPAGYFLAFSGGKDSIVLYDLTMKAGVKFDAHYNRTGIDPPELIKFIKSNYPDVTFEKPILPIWAGVVKHGLPLRTKRWCCQVLKEHAGSYRLILTGVRWSESVSRRKRPVYYEYNAKSAKQKYIKDKSFLLPIANWSDEDIWEYIKVNNMPYCELYDLGFKRIGCVLCPFSTGAGLKIEIERYPKLVDAWKRAAIRYFERRASDPGRKNAFTSGEDYFNWWLFERSKKGSVKFTPDQLSLAL